VLRAQQLRERLRLTDEVPCSGTDLQGACKLLGDAREAKALQPSADLQIAQVQREVAALAEERNNIQRELAGLGDPPAQVVRARAARAVVTERRRGATADAALAESLSQAQDRLQGIAAEAIEIGQRLQAAQTSAREERSRCDAMEREAKERHAGEVAELDAAV